jgi:hypothetical protein
MSILDYVAGDDVMQILSNYIEMTHSKYLNVILLTCKLSTSSFNPHDTSTIKLISSTTSSSIVYKI